MKDAEISEGECMMLNFSDTFKIAVIGLGYVGLPLAVEFGKKYYTIGYDVNSQRIAELKQGYDRTGEVSDTDLQACSLLMYTTYLEDLRKCNIFIISVPTPIDYYKVPDLEPLRKASKSVGQILSPQSIVIYESTVYPGVTEEVCVPILEQESKLKFNQDFFVGYSPERINPGDHNHRLTTIKKVTSGSTPEVADLVDRLYASIIPAGTHKASSIRVAEAAKVIENIQRDINIAFVNELSIIFHLLGIDTEEVLAAASTKWNFLPFRPGLVGGHCIGVDPYYLTYKAAACNYHPELILAGRRINDNMGFYVAAQFLKLLVKKGIDLPNARVLVMGLTFKENCPDLRNTRVVDIIKELQSYGLEVDIYDPWVDPQQAKREYGISLIEELSHQWDGIIIAVAHQQFHEMGSTGIRALLKTPGVLYDVKWVLSKEDVDGRL
ncbi:Vi polysaccharide biosynthesis UDP-N-acetylglucosamine C-6 dehydrogenase TviB [Thermosynechococcus sp. QKsg1]|nr:Vi polysaccharide biosynthesis UDP-N-acetylglucosamine C-6 dehydrogenase TviB [Thermosynechococcus sp. PP22]WNC53484.1 Vi polysaccharide biosynthesis UDP-N-acetylglucosamine C-6 dehydrogenase TviB [Thermosynechococcus sp. TG215]WNC58576.1 Vi polysaccharide biosynthesis UDP-N-acetylglucosamine C-6 dehydrogenase TviB [Thermosynechococcus sp. TG218]WNC85988.1 Vi polysaccharide biosynthesis UDP-N-acetylglucosamine C-6 dehydrogenase TviB [Thermosynechococcus sp. QKsg1]